LTKLGNVQPIVVVVVIEEVILHFFEDESFIGKHQVSNQEWLECIVQIRYQSKIVKWNECNQLHVLNQGPQRKESDASKEKHEELEPNDTAEVPICLDG